MKTQPLCAWVFVAGLMFLLCPSWSRSHTVGEMDFECPLCLKKFSQLMDMSGTTTGRRLDLKPLGYIAAPWRVPVCPKCKFVLFKGREEKYSKAEVANLKQFVASPDYAKLPEEESSHYRLGLIYEHLKRPSEDVAFVYLQASWQVEDKPKQCRRYLERSLKFLEQHLNQAKAVKGKADDQATFVLLRGELLRRLEKYADAEKVFRAARAELPATNAVYQAILKQQLELVAAKDAEPHPIQFSKDKKQP